jgi:hypothetical protein
MLNKSSRRSKGYIWCNVTAGKGYTSGKAK